MSTDARGELIKGARPNTGELRGQRGAKSNAKQSIPSNDHTERDRIMQRIRDHNDS